MQNELQLDIRDIFRIIARKIGFIILFVVLITVGIGVYSFYFIPPTYQASTKLIVNKIEDNSNQYQMNINDINVNLRLIDTYKEIILTPTIMDQVVTQHPEFQLNSTDLMKKVKVNSVRNTQVMTISIQDHSYTKAAQIVNSVAEVFQRKIPTIMNVHNVSILNKADLINNPAPVKPKKLLDIAIGFILSFMLAVGIVFVLEYLDDTIKTEEDVMRYLELPTIATIAKITKEDVIAAKSHKQKVGENNHAAIHQ